jgi:uncharacterized protein
LSVDPGPAGSPGVPLPPWLETRENAVRVHVHAQPGARRSRVAGEYGAALKIQIHAPPVDGKANAELIDFLVVRLGCRRAQLQLLSGEASREKTVQIEGMAAEEIEIRLWKP